MTANGRMRIEEIQDGRDGLARTINIVLDGKTIRTPNYCVPLGKTYQFDDLELRLRIQGQTKGHIGSYVIRGFDYEQVLRDRVRSIDQGTIGGESYQSPIFRDFFSKDIFFYDPSAESLEYNRYLRRLTGSKRTPPQARELGFELAKLKADGRARNLRLEKVWNFWASMMDDRRNLAKMEGHTLDYGSQTGANTVFPFMNVVKSKGHYIVSKEVNRYWKEMCETAGKPSVHYLLLNKSVFRSDELVDQICDDVEAVQTDIAVLKVKNADFTVPIDLQPREAYGRLLMAYSHLREKRRDKTATMALDCGNQMFLNAAKSFDIVARASNGFDDEKESTGGAVPPVYGSALELDEMIPLPFEKWEAQFKKIGQMACGHDYCHQNISTLDRNLLSMEAWNIHRRPHNMLTMDEWMRQVADAIVGDDARLIPQKLFHSQLKILGDIVPS
jgi:hypothetical protein